ncbi:site-specific integrase [Vibrio sp. Sgm 22]|uniref:site-specific integrase n=1 Tax=unclassified Vibrio TaxID=2614977 RepID=UPI0022492824|nr:MULTISPECIES: site-specific integrase [unclassified Vibrio]MCX2758969.1 site-specific integrase [Vibrio sp. 14G-20]MCX2774429.1 site-specific integrase [Vibrio sp. Sgm 22]
MYYNEIQQTAVPVSKTFNPAVHEQSRSFLVHDFSFIPRSAKKGRTNTATELVMEFLEIAEQHEQLSPKTLMQYRSHLQLFLDIWPLDDLNELDRENAEMVLRLLYKMPKNPSKNRALARYKGIDLLKQNNIVGGEVISRRTVQKIISLLSTFFNWVKSRGYVSENPFYRLKVRKALSTDKRYQLSSDDLTLVFNMKDYQKGSFLHSYYYWLPLLLRFTGARLNELCQLYKADLVLQDDIWGLSFTTRSDEQRIKNCNSIRFVPLHPALLSRGFVEFVQSRNSDRVFSELPLVNGYYSHNASKWFARRRSQLGLGKGRDAHSFRHTFVDDLKQNGVAIELIQELVGHSSNTVTTNVYSRSYRPQMLLTAITKISDAHVSNIQPYKN